MDHACSFSTLLIAKWKSYSLADLEMTHTKMWQAMMKTNQNIKMTYNVQKLRVYAQERLRKIMKETLGPEQIERGSFSFTDNSLRLSR